MVSSVSSSRLSAARVSTAAVSLMRLSTAATCIQGAADWEAKECVEATAT